MDTGNRMSRASRRDCWRRIYPRYQQASRREEERILDEFCANCSYHRKHAIRLLNRLLPRGESGAPTASTASNLWVANALDYEGCLGGGRLSALQCELKPWFKDENEVRRNRINRIEELVRSRLFRKGREPHAEGLKTLKSLFQGKHSCLHRPRRYLSPTLTHVR